ncbi:MAG: copper chaperone PCu(A)C [Zoogloea sp.]|nr:copper chaperone PCu(A)C [Zoogloea sp.]
MNVPFPNRVLSCRLAALLAVGAASAIHAQVTVGGVWSSPTVPNQSATGAFVRLYAHEDVVLTGVSSLAAGVVEAHELSMDKGIMRMRAANHLALKGRADDRAEAGRPAHHDDGPEEADQEGAIACPLTFSFTAADRSVSTVG